ncbi:ABC transporter ATP-binding protein [Streptomyces sp. CB01881]|uniref:ABC transporter ATP-binding protein n=1 Tax=Streptomyces sp. CB01881 TaxID=2078691 RepID=UPI000CDC6166|nr:ABC transporter ATP-binding protein [Streptomyces sp. CB01881]AUY49969.1 sulfate ABC transporter ATP-binding protein [Streptomyces sp. CB01881]TYC73366.1 ABC transporter ATP-binding protein [Streptomyces sp. CB01881]
MDTEVAAFRGVSKNYGRVRAVDGLDLVLRPGETVALLGPNGAGKSSSLDLLLGLREPDHGTVSLFGGAPRAAIAAGRVGAMLQSGGLMADVKVRELVRLACDVHPRGRAVREVLEDAGITDLAERRVDRLSGGQEQRVRFALAIAGANDLIVLDEPTTGMDVSVRKAFWASMRAQADAGRTVLFATHYLEEADSIADRVLVLHRGRLIADGTSAEIKAKAGARRITFELHETDGPFDEPSLRTLPGTLALDVSSRVPGVRTVRIRTADADAGVAGLYRAGLYPRGLEVTGLGLEQAFLTITGEQDAAGTSELTTEAVR